MQPLNTDRAASEKVLLIYLCHNIFFPTSPFHQCPKPRIPSTSSPASLNPSGWMTLIRSELEGHQIQESSQSPLLSRIWVDPHSLGQSQDFELSLLQTCWLRHSSSLFSVPPHPSFSVLPPRGRTQISSPSTYCLLRTPAFSLTPHRAPSPA